MRISSLALKAYGHFTDTVLELGDQPGLHVVLGDNESGKSTSLRALTSVLFGYPHHAVDAFRHDTLNMAIGAGLVARDGRRVEFVRRRRGKQLLTTADGKLLADSAISALLGNASQDLFERVFALDHSRLQAHAKAMLLEGGSLGFSLAEAGAGVTGIKDILDKISAQTRTLFLPTGTNPKINAQIRQLTELRKDARNKTVSPDRYQKLAAELTDAAAAVDENRAQIAELRKTLSRLERIRRNLPRKSELTAIAEQLGARALDDVPLLAPDAPARRQAVQSEAAAARRRLADATARIEQADALLAQTPVDTALLARRADIAVLTDRRGAIAKDHTDRPAVERQLTQEREKAADLLRHAEIAGDLKTLEAVLPTAVKRQAIASLIEQHKVLATRRAGALEQSDVAAIELAAAEQALTKLQIAADSSVTDTGALDSVIREADALGDIDTEIDRRRRRLAADRAALQDRCITLGLSGGDVAALRRLAVPARAAIQTFADDLARLDKAIADLDAAAARLQNDIADKTAQADRLRTTGGVLSEADLLGLRSHRDGAWALVRHRLLDDLPEAEIGRYIDASGDATPLDDNGLADLYEREVATADDAADRMRANASTVAALALFETDIAAAADKIAAITRERVLCDARRGELLQGWAAAWQDTGIAPGRPSEMIEWNDRRDEILAKDDQLVAEAVELAATEAKAGRIAAGVRQALTAHADLPADAGFSTIRDAAKRQQARLTRANQERRLAEQSIADKTGRRNTVQLALAGIDRTLADWQTAWQRATSDAGLDAALTREQAATVLQAFGDLQHQAALIRNLAHRVAGMVRDIGSFNADVTKLWTDVSSEPMPKDHLAAARLLEERVRAADHADKRRTELLRQRQAETAIVDGARQDLATSEAAMRRLCADAGCADADQLPSIEAQSHIKSTLRERRRQLESDMLHDGDGLELAPMLAECDGMAGDELPGQIAALRDNETRLDDQYRRALETATSLRTAFDQLMADEQAAVLAQRAVNTEAEIAASVDEYVCLAAEEALLRAAIELYRERHQGPVLPRARALFAELTDGTYRGLAVDSDGAEPVLIAERDDGTRLDVAALSDGTRDALYLALRLAVVQEYNARQEPLPFIADDLLLHLDDARVKAAFRALAAVAESGQVLFFTHNPHMLALARDAVPAPLLREHRLPLPVAA